MRRSFEPNLMGQLSSGCAPYVLIAVLLVLFSLGAAARAFSDVRPAQMSMAQ